jgi:AraC-like DNA-binding protein
VTGLMLLEHLLNNLALSIEAFATCRVAPGWRLRLPPLDWVTFHYVVAGEGAVRDADGRDRLLPAGTLAIVPPHLVHSLQCGVPPFGERTADGGVSTGREMPDHAAGLEPEGETVDSDPLIVVCGRLEVTYAGGIGVFDQLREVLVLDFADDPVMRKTFDRMLDEVSSGRPGSRAMTSTLMQECLIRVFRVLCGSDECGASWLRALEDPLLMPALEAMLARPGDPHSVESLARLGFMSRSAFARRFRDGLGQPPLEYLRGVRLRHAAHMMRKSPYLPLPVVARRSGFASRSHFSRAFKSYFGRTPSEYRTSIG